MKEKTIILPADLSERRLILRSELNAVIEAQVTAYLSRALKDELNQAGFTEGTATLEWDFYGEYDDEGGTDYYPSDLSLVVNGESVDMYEVAYTHTTTYSDGTTRSYKSELRDQIYDIVCGEHDDLYDQYITEITITLH